MKQVTNMSRLVNQLEKMFRVLNTELFENSLDMPVITVTPCSRSYAHYTPWNAWQAGDTKRREINIASGTLDRPLESITASLVHEMTHMFLDTVLNIQDTSRNGTYHNKYFKQEAEKHGLICNRTQKYGWSHTEPSDLLLELLCKHDELREIEMCRVNPSIISTGTSTNIGYGASFISSSNKGNSRRYICPHCHTIIRATKTVNIICGDCMKLMVEN